MEKQKCLLYPVLNRTFFIILFFDFLQTPDIYGISLLPKQQFEIKISKNITLVRLHNEKEYVYFFQYDSITSFKGIPEASIHEINTHLRSHFLNFVSETKNTQQLQITYNADLEFENCSQDNKLYLHRSTYIIDCTSNYITIGNLETWCCGQNGLPGFENLPSYTVDTKTLKPIALNDIFVGGIKDALISKIRSHPELKNLLENGKIIRQYICEEEKRDYLVQKVKNSSTTNDIVLCSDGIFLNTIEVEYCSEIQKYDSNYTPLKIGLSIKELKKYVQSENSYISINVKQ